MSKAKAKNEQGVMKIRSDIVRKYVKEIDECVKNSPQDLPELSCRFGVKGLDEGFWLVREVKACREALDLITEHMGISSETDSDAPSTFATRETG